jgi:hypothetical protein
MAFSISMAVAEDSAWWGDKACAFSRAIYEQYRLACQLAILDACGNSGLAAQAFFAIGLVFGPVAGKKNHLAVAFKCQDVGGDAIQKPAVMADDDGAASEVFKGLFQGAQGIYVQIVGGLIQQDKIGILPEGLCQMHPIALV